MFTIISLQRDVENKLKVDIMLLLRRYIGKRLLEYYSQPSHTIVGSIPSSKNIKFKYLLGEWHWQSKFQSLYKEQQGQWLTPVELFYPYYSNIIANYIASLIISSGISTSKNDNELKIKNVELIEVGGGRGTNAHAVLSHLHHHPKLNCLFEGHDNPSFSYTLIDSSPTLHEYQKQRFENNKTSNYRDNDNYESTQLNFDYDTSMLSFQQMDLIQIAEEPYISAHNKDKSARPSFLPFTTKGIDDKNTLTIVLALEVLDNLPHDKIMVQKPSSTSSHNGNKRAYLQAQVNTDLEKEYFVPSSDPLLNRVLESYPVNNHNYDSPQWIPTVACGFIQRLFNERPNAHLLLADFDSLPPPDILPSTASHRKSVPAVPGTDPLITCMEDIDHECYLTFSKECDILFPTDFTKLATFIRNVTTKHNHECDNNYEDTIQNDRCQRKVVQVSKQADFLQTYGMEQVEATKSWLTGYTPLLHDFSNCSILTVTNDKLSGRFIE